MTHRPLRKLCRPVPLMGLCLLVLGLVLLWHICRTGTAARLVPPLPLLAPGFPKTPPAGASGRVVPRAGPRLRSPASPPPAGN